MAYKSGDCCCMDEEVCKQLDEGIPEGLKEVLLRSAQGRAAVVDVMKRDDNETKIGEDLVRQALDIRDGEINHWVRNLRHEINKLTEEHVSVQKYLDECLKKFWYFKDIQRASEMSKRYRAHLECGNPNDEINRSLDKEIELAQAAIDECYDRIKELRNFLARLEQASAQLRMELRVKVIADNRVRACQQTKPLLSEPYIPEEVLNPYHPDSELEWEKKVHDLIMCSMALRLEARDYCVYALDSIQKHIGELAAAWTRTSQFLDEEIDKDEHRLDFTHKIITRLDKEINASRLRMSTFHDEYERQNLQKTFDAWKLQRLNYRPKTENIRDRPVMNLEEELCEVQKRMDAIIVNFKSDRQLLADLENMRCQQSRKIDILVKRLFADRENCRGFRRSVKLDGLKQSEPSGNGFFYVS